MSAGTTPGLRPTRFNSPALIRLLARWGHAPAAAAETSVAGAMGDWLGWADAITLSAALKAAPGVTPARPVLSDGVAACSRVRASLAAAIDADAAVQADLGRLILMSPAPGQPLESPTEYAPWRRHAVALQRRLDEGVAALRGQLRSALAATSTRGARLAALDAALEQALAARERALLATLPARLEARFVRARSLPAPAALQDEAPARWLAAFARDLGAALHAELDLRLQPAEGLAEALRTELSAPR